MKHPLVSLLLIVSVFVGSLLTGGSVVPGQHEFHQYSISSPSATDTIILAIDSLDSQNTNTSIPIDDAKLDSISKEFSSDNLPLLPNRSSAMFFRTAVQEEPIYWLVAEFNPPDLSLLVQPQLKNYLTTKPWYLITQSNSASRISGWKDSNSMYAGRKTFHLFLTHPSIGA